MSFVQYLQILRKIKPFITPLLQKILLHIIFKLTLTELPDYVIKILNQQSESLDEIQIAWVRDNLTLYLNQSVTSLSSDQKKHNILFKKYISFADKIQKKQGKQLPEISRPLVEGLNKFIPSIFQ